METVGVILLVLLNVSGFCFVAEVFKSRCLRRNNWPGLLTWPTTTFIVTTLVLMMIHMPRSVATAKHPFLSAGYARYIVPTFLLYCGLCVVFSYIGDAVEWRHRRRRERDEFKALAKDFKALTDAHPEWHNILPSRQKHEEQRIILLHEAKALQ